MEELEVNMEDNEDAESTKSEVKLGKLQFSMDYDFQKGEVSLHWPSHHKSELTFTPQVWIDLHTCITLPLLLSMIYLS